MSNKRLRLSSPPDRIYFPRSSPSYSAFDSSERARSIPAFLLFLSRCFQDHLSVNVRVPQVLQGRRKEKNKKTRRKSNPEIPSITSLPPTRLHHLAFDEGSSERHPTSVNLKSCRPTTHFEQRDSNQIKPSSCRLPSRSASRCWHWPFKDHCTNIVIHSSTSTRSRLGPEPEPPLFSFRCPGSHLPSATGATGATGAPLKRRPSGCVESNSFFLPVKVKKPPQAQRPGVFAFAFGP